MVPGVQAITNSSDLAAVSASIAATALNQALTPAEKSMDDLHHGLALAAAAKRVLSGRKFRGFLQDIAPLERSKGSAFQYLENLTTEGLTYFSVNSPSDLFSHPAIRSVTQRGNKGLMGPHGDPEMAEGAVALVLVTVAALILRDIAEWTPPPDESKSV